MMRIVFMGTPAFAVPALRALHEAGPAQGWQVVGVATQPDRPAGRGKQVVMGPVKQYAVEQGLPVLQPLSLRKEPGAGEAVAELAALVPDVIVVAAYGLILPKRVLELPAFGCVNVHASLLPAYRGASPITQAILDGQAETGVSIMLMDEGMDTGPVLAQGRLGIEAQDTTASLSARLAELGAALLVETLPGWVAGEVAPIPQGRLPGEVSVVRLIKKEAGLVDWTQPAAQIERMTRAYAPWPGAYTLWRGEVFKLVEAGVLPGSAGPGQAGPGQVGQGTAEQSTVEPGRVVMTAQGLAVGTGDGLLLLVTVQPAGKKAMPAGAFVNGAAGFVGSVLGEEPG